MTCSHNQITQITRDYGFCGSVAASADFENRAAHGGITYTVECDRCGARQSRNQNQNHIERGPWSETREQRRKAADRKAQYLTLLRHHYPTAPSPVTVTSETRGLSVTVTCDSDGMLSFAPLTGHEDAIAQALPQSWLDQACAVRAHHQLVECTEGIVADLREAV